MRDRGALTPWKKSCRSLMLTTIGKTTLGMYHKNYQLAQRNPLGKVSEEINLCPLHNPSNPFLTHGSSLKVDMFSSNLF
jgi:hypothetical protein